MSIKKSIKAFGRLFIALKQVDERIIQESVLIVDNGYCKIAGMDTAIQKIQYCFPKAGITVLSFAEERRSHLQKEFPALQFILPPNNAWLRRYQIALQMISMRQKKFDFIVLFSLDITPLVAALGFFKANIVLCNQWGQWWHIRLRDFGRIPGVTYVKEKSAFSVKNFLKKLGLFFVSLERGREEIIKYSILIVDNGTASFEQIGYVAQRIKESFPLAGISVLAIGQRKELWANFREIEIIEPENFLINRYRMLRHMIRLRNHRYDRIVLLSLDITPVVVSFLLMKSKVILVNRWLQWWSLKPKPIEYYLTIIPRLAGNLIVNALIFIYLLINISWVLFKKSFNVLKFHLFKGGY